MRKRLKQLLLLGILLVPILLISSFYAGFWFLYPRTPPSSPLHHAAERGDTDLIKLLVTQAGVSVDEPTPYDLQGLPRDSTPLMIAAKSGRLDAVAELLQLGASIRAENAAGLTAVDYASQHGHEEIISLLQDSQDLSDQTREERMNEGGKG